MNSQIQNIANRLTKNGCLLVPCTEEELNSIKLMCQESLPESYMDFMKIMGKGAGDFMKGSSVFYDELFDIREGAQDLLCENGLKTLTSDCFVFWMHQGYQFAFFMLGDEEDPNVFFYYEGKAEIEDTKMKFTEFLNMQMQAFGF